MAPEMEYTVKVLVTSVEADTIGSLAWTELNLPVLITRDKEEASALAEWLTEAAKEKI